jgi:CRP-like cAMP-binding protein
MPASKKAHPAIENRLLAALSRKDYQRLLPYLETVSLAREQILHEADQHIPYAYFPITGVLSLLTIMEDGTAVEVGTAGNEGMIGIPLALGSDESLGRAISQIPGYSVRIKAAVLKKECQRGGALLKLLHRYVRAMLIQTAQLTACRSLHPIQPRFIRWLLMTHDRVRSDTFVLTQELMAIMLGIRRASVSEAASQLQRAGLIRYRRGRFTIVDRPGLEASVCECYWIIKKEFNSVIR